MRAIDAANTPMPWTTATPFTFQRNWPQKPTLEYPLEPVRPDGRQPDVLPVDPRPPGRRLLSSTWGATRTSRPDTYVTCTTTSTTYAVNGNCGALGQGQTTYWRVKALDYYPGSNQPVEGIYSDIHHFVYSAGQITQTSPADGDTVDVPTLDWDPIAGTQTYHVVDLGQGRQPRCVARHQLHQLDAREHARPVGQPLHVDRAVHAAHSGNISPLYPGITVQHVRQRPDRRDAPGPDHRRRR